MSGRGFTLLELMLALAVLSIVAVAVLGRGAETVRTLSGLEERTLAQWVAENELARLRLAQRRDAGKLRDAAAEAAEEATLDSPAEAGQAPPAPAGPGQRPAMPVGTSRSERQLGGRSWRIVLETARTEHPALRRVSVHVYAASEGVTGPALATLVGFVGRS